MKYKMIIFDADDTLYDFAKAEVYAFEKTMKDLQLPYKEYLLETYIRINKQIWHELDQGKIKQEELKVERFRRFLAEVNLHADPKLFSESFMDNLAQAGFLLDGAKELVENLSKNYRLVMITNGLTRVQKHRIRKHEIAQYFETVIISEEIGYAKPDPMIFEVGLRDLAAVSKSDIIIVGDSLTSDIPGGINYGIDTCWYNPQKKANTSKYLPTYEINDLNQLYEVLSI